MNQADLILAYLTAGGTLTVGEALTKFGCYALSQRIGDLKRDGVPIESKMITLPNGKRIAQYKIGTIAHG